MVKNYHCDYCGKTFRDILAVRKNHLKGAQHRQMMKEHYDKHRGKQLLITIIEINYC